MVVKFFWGKPCPAERGGGTNRAAQSRKGCVMALVYLGLGSNLGDREKNLDAARQALAQLRGSVLIRNAPLYETPPVGGPSGQDKYLNSASLMETSLRPHEFLREIQAVERGVGRIRENETVRWGPRVIDIDILFWDDAVFDGEELAVPHPRMAERAFVLLPMADLDKDFLHPVLDLTIAELLQRLDLENEGIQRLPV